MSILKSNWSHKGTSALLCMVVCGWVAYKVKRNGLSVCLSLFSLDLPWGSSLHCFLTGTHLWWVVSPVPITSGHDSLLVLFMWLLCIGPVDATVFYIVAVSLLTKGLRPSLPSSCRFRSIKKEHLRREPSHRNFTA